MDANRKLQYNAMALTARMLADTTIRVAETLQGLLGPNEVTNEAIAEAENVKKVCKEIA